MHSPSRRAFLRGRRLPQSPWQQFCERLRSAISSEFIEFEASEQAGSGRLTLERPTDVHHLRSLCEQFGVVLALDGLAMPKRHPDQSLVWVRPGKGLSQLQQVDDDGHQWFVQPGCSLGALVAAGFPFEHLSEHITIATWLADRTLCDYAIGETAYSGVQHASVLLSDGNQISLGPFSKDDTQPLQGMRLQQLAPALFRMAASPAAQRCAGADFWPVRYRLDAVMESVTPEINLAQLLLGHGGDLGWVEWLVLDRRRCQPKRVRYDFSSAEVESLGLGNEANDLEWEIKSLLDPYSVFPGPGQDL